MFSTILSAELVSGEPSDGDSARIETGGDSLTFSESHWMGAELRLGLVTFVPLEVDSVSSSPGARLLGQLVVYSHP